jgi:MFS family permease
MSLPPATLQGRSYFGIPSSILRIQLSVLCAAIGMGMVYSVLTLNGKSLGANAWHVGLLLAAFGGVRCLANLPTGIASEYFGRRWTAIGGLVAAAAASFAAAAALDFATLLASVLVLGFALGIYNTASLGAIVDLGTHETRVRDMAAYQGTFLLGLSLGPALGGVAAAQWGFGGVYALQGMLAIVAMLVLCRAADVAPRQRVKLDLRIVSAIAGPAAMIYGITFARCVTIWVLLPLVASVRFGMDLDMIGLMLTVGCAATLAVLPIVAPLTRRCGRLPVMLGASVLLIAGLALLAADASMTALWLSSLVLGAASGVALPVSMACAADAAPRGQIGVVMGFMRSVIDVAVLTSPLIVGAAVDQLSSGQSWAVAICITILFGAAVVFWMQTPLRPITTTSAT